MHHVITEEKSVVAVEEIVNLTTLYNGMSLSFARK